MQQASAHPFQLDGTCRPLYYELDFKPHGADRDLESQVRIGIVVVAPSIHSITLNALDLNIVSAAVHLGKVTHQINTTEIAVNVQQETITIPLPAPISHSATAKPIASPFDDIQDLALIECDCVLEIVYHAAITVDVKCCRGMFLHDEHFDPHCIATSLEPVYARTLYPCFDETIYKARFQLTVRGVPSLYTVLSNTLPLTVTEYEDPTQPAVGTVTPQELQQASSCNSASASTNNSPSREPSQPTKAMLKDVVFEVTPPICTYLVSIVVGQFHSLQTTATKRNLLTRVFFPTSDPQSDGMVALDLLKRAVEYFEELFAFELPVKKLDLVALHNFTLLGMENWGLVVVLKDYFVVSEVTSIERRQRIARLIGHEVMHQWFGNMVSIDRWTSVWMKEGFARFFEFFFVDRCFPKWQVWTEFVEKVHNDALFDDVNRMDSHEIEFPECHPRKLFEFFDRISYGKAACVIRMVCSTIGEHAFIEGIRHFVQKHRMGVASNNDLYTAFEESQQALQARMKGIGNASAAPVREIFKSWNSKVGHPYLFIEGQMSDDKPVLVLHQLQMINTRSGLVPRLITACNSPRESARLSNPLHVTPPKHQRTASLSKTALLHPCDSMAPANYIVPMRITEIEPGRSTATTSSIMEGPEQRIPYNNLSLFNTASAGAFRCDYETPMWLKLIEVFPFLSATDRLTMIITLFELRTFHVGMLKQNDMCDRSQLLLHGLAALGDRETNQTVWEYVSNELFVLINLVYDHPCWNRFRTFVCHIHQRLLASHTLTFWPVPVNPADFMAASSLTPYTVSKLLRNLCVCGEQSVVAEAREFFLWVVSSTLEGIQSPADRSNKLLSVDKSDTDMLRVAVEAICMHGTIDEWWMVLCILLQLDGVIPNNIALLEEASQELFMDIKKLKVQPLQQQEWYSVCLHGVLCRPDASVLSLQLKLLHAHSFTVTLVHAMYVNTKLFFQYVEDIRKQAPKSRAQRVASTVATASHRYCSNRMIAQLLEEEGADTTAIDYNCIWAEYTSDHYSHFLRRFFGASETPTQESVTPQALPPAAPLEMFS